MCPERKWKRKFTGCKRRRTKEKPFLVRSKTAGLEKGKGQILVGSRGRQTPVERNVQSDLKGISGLCKG